MENYELTEALKEKLDQAETVDEVIAIFAEEGIKVTKEQVEAEIKKAEGEELDVDALDSVSGGVVVPLLAAAAVVGISHWVNKRIRDGRGDNGKRKR